MTYEEAINYLNSFIDYERISTFNYLSSIKLERMEKLLSFLDDPHKNINAIHIAGTKGKGSTCAMVASILREAGYKVGLYTSPHLVDFRERIRILDSEFEKERMISEEKICKLVEKIQPWTNKISDSSELGPLSFFELYTALAFLYFKEEKVDFMVLEVGLGGRLDATNVVKPLVCGITQISFEHTDKLGTTLEAIAGEKAGIVKSHVTRPSIYSGQDLSRTNVRDHMSQVQIVVSAPQEEVVAGVIRDVCRKKGARLYEVGENIFFEEVNFDREKQIFNIKGVCGEYSHLEMRLLGYHQLINAAVAVGIIELLRSWDIFISYESIRNGLEKVRWPGRLETVGKEPLVVLDGAQNVASAIALREAIKKFFTYDKLILVLGISNDKDIRGICQQLSEISDSIIVTKANNPRAVQPMDIRTHIENTTKEVTVTYTVEEALKGAKQKAKKDDMILVTGSLYVVGEARQICLGPCKVTS